MRHRTYSLLLIAVIASFAVMFGGAAYADPEPGVGVFFTAEDVPLMRERINEPPLDRVYQRLLNAANEGMRRWPEDQREHGLPERADQLIDLYLHSIRRHVSDDKLAASEALGGHVRGSAPSAAFVYLMTGDEEYGRYAWEVFETAARVPRWGWWAWGALHGPHIHWGTNTRNMVLIADCVWDMLDDDQRAFTKEIVAEKGVEPYYRLLLHTPAFGLHHLRIRNQGHNVLCAALTASLFVGDDVPGNVIWRRSLLQTFHWSLTHAVGRMAQELQSGLVNGYWCISVQNLYTGVIAARNALGIDMTPNHGISEAAMYPILHMVTIPMVTTAGARQGRGLLNSNPISLMPHAGGGPFWLSYAAENPESPGAYYVKNFIDFDRLEGLCGGHQGNLSHVLTIAWWDTVLMDLDPPEPQELSLFSDRMANLRSGYNLGDTSLFYRGELFLSARNEILNFVSGHSWHYKWHQYQAAESGIETEGELFAPSMVIRDAFDDGARAYLRAESGTSEIFYYRDARQAASYRNYDRRDRGILYVRPEEGTPDYFIFHDRVRHTEGPRWYAWTWHLFNEGANPENYGRYQIEGANAVRAQRPNADLWIEFLTPDEMAFEQQGIPSQINGVTCDHNGLMLRAIAGGYEPVEADKLTLPVSDWPEGLWPPTPDGEVNPGHLTSVPLRESIELGVVEGIVGGMRYRWAIDSKTKDHSVYRSIAWWLELELLNADGEVVARRNVDPQRPHPLLLSSPSSFRGSEDWRESANYFDAPDDAVAARVIFGATDFELRQHGELWLKDLVFEPLGFPRRSDEQRFLAIVMPLDKEAPAPNVRREDGRWVIDHGNGVEDHIRLDGEDFVVQRMSDGAMGVSFTSDIAEGEGVVQMDRNTPENARRIAAGLEPIIKQLNAERDALTSRGMRNLAIGARVTASAELDERFAAGNVVDNRVAEYPEDGALDYTLGEVITSGMGGYGGGGHPGQLMNDPIAFPLYVRPSYWLLPPFESGWVELELAETATVARVRLLNTSNAGLNDFATMRYRVELRDEAGELLASKEGRFGRVFDRTFKHVFLLPDILDSCGTLYGDMLKPETPVPFGDGWQEVEFDAAPGVRRVRVVVLDHWAIGGGLNEVQVYAEAPE